MTFAVEAYKKPEYVVDVAAPRFVVGGEAGRFGITARYFFGRPAAGGPQHVMQQASGQRGSKPSTACDSRGWV